MNYQKARSYSYVLSKELYRDILHDAFLGHYDRTGRDLFTEHPGTVMSTIKYTWKGYYLNKRYVRNQRTRFEEYIDEEIGDYPTTEGVLSLTETVSKVSRRIHSQYPRSSDNMLRTIQLRHDGYSQIEISRILGVSQTLITYYGKNIRKLYDLESR